MNEEPKSPNSKRIVEVKEKDDYLLSKAAKKRPVSKQTAREFNELKKAELELVVENLKLDHIKKQLEIQHYKTDLFLKERENNLVLSEFTESFASRVDGLSEIYGASFVIE